MPKKSSSRKKGIQRGIPRNRVGSEEPGSGHETENSQFLGFSGSKYLSLGEICFKFMLAGCEKFHILGFTRTQNGEFVQLNRNARFRHYAVIAFCLAICIQKIWGTVQAFVYGELGVKSFLCLSVALVHIVTMLLGAGVLMRPKETTDMLNSWPHMAASMKKIDPDSKFHPLNNISACIKTVCSALVGQAIAVGVPLLGLLMSDLPIFLFPILETSGLLPGGILPNWAWQIMCAPLEWLIIMPFMLVGTFSANYLYMEIGALDIYLKMLRGINVTSVRSRRRLEQMYVELELFNRIAQVWIRFYFPPWLLGLSLGVIVAAVVSIRYTEMPLIIYILFPYTTSTLIMLIFWLSYDMLRVIRASEDILGSLWRHDASYFDGMTRTKRVELMKRSKTMRPVVISVADSEFSLNLPINTWDEIINQILFFLSL